LLRCRGEQQQACSLLGQGLYKQIIFTHGLF
jgi:hypothetical protein